MKSIGLTAIILVLTSAVAEVNMTFEDWDKNENGYISRSEFVDVFVVHFIDDWDLLDDGYFDDEDIYKGTFKIWDVDDDTLLTEEEWLYGYDYYYGDYVFDDFVALDTDGDGKLEYIEYYDILEESDFYENWDVNKDKNLNEYELARMLFNNWDFDDSNFIEPDEYEEFDSYYLDI